VISEHHGRIRPGEHLRQVDDPDIAERARGIYLHQWLLGLIERTTLDLRDELITLVGPAVAGEYTPPEHRACDRRARQRERLDPGLALSCA
jgi:hypothetical protein